MDRCRPGTIPSTARMATPATGGGVRRHRGRRPPTVGPSSFARAERPNITDERRRQEESYSNKAVRLLTGSGDVVVTVNRRRTSAWGTQDRAEPHLDRARTAGENNASRGNTRSEVAASSGKYGDTSRSLNGEGRIGNRFKKGKQQKGESRGVDTSFPSAGTTAGTRASGVLTLQKNVLANGTLEAQAMKLLPTDLALALPPYREPGRAQLPLIFRATSAPIVKSSPAAVRAVSVTGGARRISRRRSLSAAPKGGVIMDSDGPVGDFRYQREANGLIIPKMQSAEETGNAARNPSAAEGGDGSGCLLYTSPSPRD